MQAAPRSSRQRSDESLVGLVLSAGGARGAYEVGVLSGLAEVLGLRATDRSPFRVIAGSSVGAIHGAFVAAHADRGDFSCKSLEEAWRSLRLNTHLRLRPLQFLRGAGRPGRALLDVAPLEALVRGTIPFARIRHNVSRKHVQALFIAALHVTTGRTVLFAELAPGAGYAPSHDRRRKPHRTVIGAEHVLASMALPLLFPARRIGGTYYCDGGLRFNTPIAPAIRAGADRLVVIAPLEPFQTVGAPDTGDRVLPPVAVEDYPGPLFILGRLLDVLLMDPVLYDLQMLDRHNQLVDALESELSAEALRKVNQALIATRGAAYRRVRTLLFTPSEDVGKIAARHLKQVTRSSGLSRNLELLLRYAGRSRSEADWASYLLFDGDFTSTLIELGRRDARTRSAEIIEFFRPVRRRVGAPPPRTNA